MNKLVKKISLSLVVGTLFIAATPTAAEYNPEALDECKQQCYDSRYNLLNLFTKTYTDDMYEHCVYICQLKYL